MRSRVHREIAKTLRRLGWSGILVAFCVVLALILSNEGGPVTALAMAGFGFLALCYAIAWIVDRLAPRRSK
jgi:hypothetical protein